MTFEQTLNRMIEEGTGMPAEDFLRLPYSKRRTIIERRHGKPISVYGSVRGLLSRRQVDRMVRDAVGYIDD